MRKRYFTPSALATVTLYLIPSPAYCLPLHCLPIDEKSLILENGIRDLLSQPPGTSSLWLDLGSCSAADGDTTDFGVVEPRGSPETLGSKSQHYLGSAPPFIKAYLSEIQQSLLQSASGEEVGLENRIQDRQRQGPRVHAAPANKGRIPLSPADLYDTILPTNNRRRPHPASSGWREAFMSLTILGGAVAGASLIGGVGLKGYNRYQERKRGRSDGGEKVSTGRDQENASISDLSRTRTEAGGGDERNLSCWRRVLASLTSLVRRPKQ